MWLLENATIPYSYLGNLCESSDAQAVLGENLIQCLHMGLTSTLECSNDGSLASREGGVIIQQFVTGHAGPQECGHGQKQAVTCPISILS